MQCVGDARNIYVAADFARELERELAAANEMRGHALFDLGITQNERDAAERHIARESRISDSEMMALLRRRSAVGDELVQELAEVTAKSDKYESLVRRFIDGLEVQVMVPAELLPVWNDAIEAIAAPTR